MNQPEDEIKKQLAHNENLLWFGQPRQGVFLRGSDALMIPFSFLWGGFAFFWEFSVIDSNAPAFFMLWGIPFVLVGTYIIIGRFFVEAAQRARTIYAVTNERIIIISGMLGRKTRSINLRTLSDFSLTEGRGTEGTITLGGGLSANSLFGGFSGWPGMDARMGPRFELIPEAKKVYEIIRSSQRAAS